MTSFLTTQGTTSDPLKPAQSLAPAAIPQVAGTKLSVRELNNLDLEDISQRLKDAAPDQRSAITRFLDGIDTGRNVALGSLFPTIRKQKEADGDTAAFGLGRVNGADVLQSFGVENRVVRGIGGLGIDLFFDPLTWIGPAGWAVKAGRVALRGGASKALRVGAEELLRTGRVADAEVGALLNAAGWSGPKLDTLRASVSAGTASVKNARGQVMNSVLGEAGGGPLAAAFSRVGAGVERSGGMVDRYLYAAPQELVTQADQEAAAAVRAFTSKWAKGTEPGIAIGKNATSQIAHIPFTDIGIRVPAFTGGARAAVRNLRIAGDAGAGMAAINSLEDAARAFDMAAGAVTPASISGNLSGLRDTADLVENGYVADLDSAVAVAKDHADRIKSIVGDLSANPASLPVNGQTPKDLLALGYAADAADAELARVTSRANSLKSGLQGYAEYELAANKTAFLDRLPPERRAALQTIIDDPERAEALGRIASSQVDALQRIAQVYKAPVYSAASGTDMALAEVGKMVLNTSDDIQGLSVIGSVRASLQRAAALKDDNAVVKALEQADDAWRKRFGLRNGEVHDLTRPIAFAMSGTGRTMIREREADRVGRTVTAALRASGLDEQQHYADASRLALAMLYRSSDPSASRVFWARPEFGELTFDQVKALHDAGQDVGSDLFKTLYNSERTGLLAGRPELKQALTDIAADSAARLDEIGRAELDDGLLGSMRTGYVPNIKTPEAASNVARVTSEFGTGSREAGSAATPSFARARTFDQTRFQDPDTGKWLRFFEADRDWDAATVARLPPLLQADVQEARAAVARYDELVVSGMNLPGPRQTDVLEMNELARSGWRFEPMMGGAKTDLFATDLPMVMAGRLADHESSVAQRQASMLLRRTALFAEPRSLQLIANTPGKKVILEGGIEATASQARSISGETVTAVRVGDTSYRRLDSKLRDNGLLKLMFGAGAEGALVPVQIADRLESIADGHAKHAGSIMDAAESFTSWWRTTTLLHPSWMINDLIGNISLLAAGDGFGGTVSFRTLIPNLITAGKLMLNRHNPEALAKLRFTVRGQSMTGDELLREVTARGQIDNNQALTSAFMAAWAGAIRLPGDAVPGQRGFSTLRPAAWMERLKAAGGLPEFAQASARNAGRAAPSVLDYASGASRAGDRALRGITAPWFKTNALMNDTVRVAAYLNFIEQGSTPTEAARSVMRMLYDYHDMTRTEQGLRTVIPFYSWIRNNIPHQFRLLANNPKYAASFPKMKEAIEESFAGDERVPEYMRPAWIRDAMSVQFTTDPATRQAFMLMSSLPPRELAEIGQGFMGSDGVQDVFHYFASSLNPAINLGIGLATGREVFSGRTIGQEGDFTPGQFVAKTLLRPVAEIGFGGANSGPLVQAFEKGTGTGVSRLLLGGKVQDISDERLRRANLNAAKTQEEQIRRRLNKAERMGDQPASFEARVSLMQLYRTMLSQGLEADVPVWAREQLNQINGSAISEPAALSATGG